MQLASITFDGEKKKASSFIIPPSNFTKPPIPTPALKISTKEKEIITNNEYSQGDSAPPRESQLPSAPVKNSGNFNPQAAKPDEENKPETSVEKLNEIAVEEPTHASEEVKTETKPPSVENTITKKKVSGLSLKSIQKKKEIEAEKREARKEEAIEKNGEFTQEDMQAAWKEFTAEQNEKGGKILASIMQTDTPVLKGNDICIELPNDTMKLELEKVQYYLMGFMKDKLQNTHIQLKISVNEKAEKKFAFTPIEKFEKLQEKNPLLEKLRSTFDLDI